MRTLKPRNSVQALMSGFSIIEALVASVIVMTSFLGLAVVMTQIQRVDPKVKVSAIQQSLEASIVTTLQDPSQMAGIQTVSDLQKIMIHDSQGVLIAQAPKGNRKYFDLEGKTCPAYNDDHCFISTELDIQCSSVSTASYQFCQAAYRVAVEANKKGIQVHNLGSQGTQFQVPQDYQVPIAFDLFSRSKNVETCTGSSDAMIVTGYERDTGKVRCAKLPQAVCPQGTVSLGIKFVPTGGNPITGSFEFDCQPMKKIGCDLGYVLQNFDPSSLHPSSSAVQGQCVYAGQDLVSRTVSHSEPMYVGGVLCPPDYEVVSGSVSCNLAAAPSVSCQTGWGPTYCTKTTTQTPPATQSNPNPTPQTVCVASTRDPIYGTVQSQFSNPTLTINQREASCETTFSGYSGSCIDGTAQPSQVINVQISGVSCRLTRPSTMAAKEIP